jgi:hypothetical protein
MSMTEIMLIALCHVADLLNAAPMLCDKIRQANVLRAQRFGRFPRQPF